MRTLNNSTLFNVDTGVNSALRWFYRWTTLNYTLKLRWKIYIPWKKVNFLK